MLNIWALIDASNGQVTPELDTAITRDNVNSLLAYKHGRASAWTALDRACYFRNASNLIRMLLQRGAIPKTFAPVWFVDHIGCSSACEYLRILVIVGGADVNQVTHQVLTTFSYALQKHRAKDYLLLTLVQLGARVTGSQNVPEWLTRVVTARNRCRAAARQMIGIRRHSFRSIDRNVMQLVARAIYATIESSEWHEPKE